MMVFDDICWEVYLHDRETGLTEELSKHDDGGQANSSSFGGSNSADGRYVIFETSADNVVPGDANGHNTDIILLERQSGEKSLVSAASDGTGGNDSSGSASISADGNSVVFSSYATNLVTDDTNGWADVFLHNLETGETWRISVNADGVQGDQNSGDPVVSKDGRFVAFQSEANNLVPGDTNHFADVFVRYWGSLGSLVYLPIISNGH